MPSLKLFRWTLVYVCMVLPALQFGECVLGTLSSQSAKGNFERHKRQGVNLSHSHSDNGVFDSIDRVPPQLCLVRRQCGSDPNVQQRTKPKPKARHKKRTESCFWLVVHLILMTFVRTNDQVAVVLTKETFHCSAVESMVVVVASSCSASAKLQAMSRVITRPKNVDQKRNQYAPKVLKSSCSLDNHLTLEQLSNNECRCNPDERRSPAGMLFVQRATGNLLQVPRSWEKTAFVRQFVFSTKDCRKLQNSRLLRFCFMCGEKKRWTNQKSSSSKDGMNPQAELMEKWFSSYSTHFLAYGRGISCARSTGVFFGKVRVKMDNMKLQKSVTIEWWTKFLFSPKNHLSVSDLTVKMLTDLISSASDSRIVFGICGYLVKISEIGLDSRRNTTSVVLTPTVSESATLSRHKCSWQCLPLCSDRGG